MAVNINNGIVQDSIGFYVDFANRKSFAPNLINYTSWNVGSGTVPATPALYGMTNFIQNGDTNENVRTAGNDPFGYNNAIVWTSSSNTVIQSNASGGWDSGLLAVDPTKLYRFSVWTKRDAMTTGSNVSGSFYMGHVTFNSGQLTERIYALNSGGTDTGSPSFLTYSTTNPYFHVTAGDIAGAQAPQLGGLNVWTLVVAHIWPIGTSRQSLVFGSNVGALARNYAHPDSGVWTRTGGKVGNLRLSESLYTNGAAANNPSLQSDYVFNSTTAFARHRAYLFYSQDLGSTQSFIYPRVDIVDGTEPTIEELLRGPEPVKDLSPKNNTIYPFSSTNFDPGGKGLIFSYNEREIVGGTLSTTFSATSISVWFNPATTILTSTLGQTLVQFGPIEGAALFLYLGDVTGGLSNEIISIASSVGNTLTYVATTSAPSLLANTWYNLALSFNGTKYDIYLNGVSMATLATPAGNTVPIPSVNYVAIGGRRYTGISWGAFFNGRIGSVLAYERSLTAAEVLANYESMKRKYGID